MDLVDTMDLGPTLGSWSHLEFCFYLGSWLHYVLLTAWVSVATWILVVPLILVRAGSLLDLESLMHHGSWPHFQFPPWILVTLCTVHNMSLSCNLDIGCTIDLGQSWIFVRPRIFDAPWILATLSVSTLDPGTLCTVHNMSLSCNLDIGCTIDLSQSLDLC